MSRRQLRALRGSLAVTQYRGAWERSLRSIVDGSSLSHGPHLKRRCRRLQSQACRSSQPTESWSLRSIRSRRHSLGPACARAESAVILSHPFRRNWARVAGCLRRAVMLRDLCRRLSLVTLPETPSVPAEAGTLTLRDASAWPWIPAPVGKGRNAYFDRISRSLCATAVGVA